MASQQYQYQACDTIGNIQSGQISADSEHEAVALLQARKLIPISVKQSTERENGQTLFSRGGVSTADVIQFTNGLCTLVETHVPLDRSLALLESLTEKPSMRRLVSTLRREVKEGKSLAEALRGFPQVFSTMYVNMVHAGEEGGILDKLLPRLERFLEQAEESRRTIISALIYPAILATVGILSIVLLLVFVVPKFAVLFADMGTAMPASAAVLLGVSAWLKSYGWTLLPVPLIFFFLWKQWGATPERLAERDASLLQLPLFGGLILHTESSRFCRTLGALLGAGIPLLKALHIVRGVINNCALRNALEQVEEAVRSGISLGKALDSSGCFPLVLSQLVIVGEESGRTAMVLDKLAESFDTQVRHRTSRMVAMVEPLLILFLGVVVGAVVITMLSAVFSINDVQY